MEAQVSEQTKCGLALDLLRAQGKLTVRALGASMLPLLWPGDLVTIESRRLEAAEAGDVVLFVREGRFFIHRVVRTSMAAGKALLITRGDCMAHEDPPVHGKEFLGIVSQIQRDGLVLRPRLRLSRRGWILAWMLCRWGLLRRVALRFHSRRTSSVLHLEWAVQKRA